MAWLPKLVARLLRRMAWFDTDAHATVFSQRATSVVGVRFRYTPLRFDDLVLWVL